MQVVPPATAWKTALPWLHNANCVPSGLQMIAPSGEHAETAAPGACEGDAGAEGGVAPDAEGAADAGGETGVTPAGGGPWDAVTVTMVRRVDVCAPLAAEGAGETEPAGAPMLPDAATEAEATGDGMTGTAGDGMPGLAGAAGALPPAAGAPPAPPGVTNPPGVLAPPQRGM